MCCLSIRSQVGAAIFNIEPKEENGSHIQRLLEIFCYYNDSLMSVFRLKCFHRQLAEVQFQQTPSGKRFRWFFNLRGLRYFTKKCVITALLRYFMQQKPNWIEMDIIILIVEFFHILGDPNR